VDGGDGSLLGIDEKNRDTVGGLDAKKKSGLVCDRCVTTAGVSRSCIEYVDDVGVELFQGDESKIRCAESGEETAAIFQDIFAGVPFGETEIEDLFYFFVGDRRAADQSADAAEPSTETVDQPGEFVKRGYLEDSKPARAVLGPSRGAAGADAWPTHAALRGYCFRGSHSTNSIIGVGRGTEKREKASPLKG
jgi:hypothetical protein